MSQSSDEEAKKEAERQSRIAELKVQLSSVDNSITHFTNVLRTLTDGKTSLTSYNNTLDTDVFTPVDSYAIYGSNDWEGTNADDAVTSHVTVKSSNTSYQTELTQLTTDIQDGIDNANEKIQSLYNERNNILSQLRDLGA